VLAAMRDPALYGLPRGTEIEVRETQGSTVFLAGGRAYKVKKPVRLGYLDYGTLARRRAFCVEEVRLNRPYAPRTYIGVRAIVPAGGGFAFSGPDDPHAIEYAVEMRRLDEDRTLERLVRSRRADDRLVERVARRIAELHAAAPVARRSPAETWAPIEENLDALRRHTGSLLDPGLFEAVRRHAEAFAAANRELMSARAAAGHVRDVHGDLRAEHIVAEDGLVIFDRIEFDARLREIDVAGDLAFTVMDLARLGAPDLARVLVRAYVEASGDTGVHDLLPFYASYRAAVRSKVACVRLEQLGTGDPERARLEHEAESLLELALRFAWRSRMPLALVFCGVAASGKSALAVEVAARSGLRRVSSDELRKRLAGLSPGDRGAAELYSNEHTDRTYAEVVRESAAALAADAGVIVDATFHERGRRRALADTLRAGGARVLFCECRAPTEALRRRGAAREAGPELGSDATWEVISKQRAGFDPLEEVPEADRLVIGTGGPVEESLSALEGLVSDAVDLVPKTT
jgi:aminoglycoside phosphotransferase family enzyme/predicted kinase